MNRTVNSNYWTNLMPNHLFRSRTGLRMALKEREKISSWEQTWKLFFSTCWKGKLKIFSEYFARYILKKVGGYFLQKIVIAKLGHNKAHGTSNILVLFEYYISETVFIILHMLHNLNWYLRGLPSTYYKSKLKHNLTCVPSLTQTMIKKTLDQHN